MGPSPMTFQLQAQVRVDAHSALATNSLVYRNISQGGAAVDMLFDSFVRKGGSILAALANDEVGLQFLGSVRRFANASTREEGFIPEWVVLRGLFETYLGMHPPMETDDVVLEGGRLVTSSGDGCSPRLIPDGSGD